MDWKSISRTTIGWSEYTGELPEPQHEVFPEIKKGVEQTGNPAGITDHSLSSERKNTFSSLLERGILLLLSLFHTYIEDTETTEFLHPETINIQTEVTEIIAYQTVTNMFGLDILKSTAYIYSSTDDSELWVTTDHSIPSFLHYAYAFSYFLPAIGFFALYMSLEGELMFISLPTATTIFTITHVAYLIIGASVLITVGILGNKLDVSPSGANVIKTNSSRNATVFTKISLIVILPTAILNFVFSNILFTLLLPIPVLILTAMYESARPLRWKYNITANKILRFPSSVAEVTLLSQIGCAAALLSIYIIIQKSIPLIGIQVDNANIYLTIPYLIPLLVWPLVYLEWGKMKDADEMVFKNTNSFGFHADYFFSLAILVLSTLLSAITMCLLWLNVQYIVSNSNEFVSFSIESISIILGITLTIFYITMLYVFILPVQFLNFFDKSRPESYYKFESSLSDFVTPEIYVRTDDGPTAAGLLDGKECIFISEMVVDNLSEDELKAVLAHEAAHANKYRDSLLYEYSPIIAALSLTTRSILLFAIGTRYREFRADKYAIDRLIDDNSDPKALIRALSKISDLIESDGKINQKRNTGSSAFISSIRSPSSTTDTVDNNWLSQVHYRLINNIKKSSEPVRDILNKIIPINNIGKKYSSRLKSRLQHIYSDFITNATETIEVAIGSFAISEAHPELSQRISHAEWYIDNKERGKE